MLAGVRWHHGAGLRVGSCHELLYDEHVAFFADGAALGAFVIGDIGVDAAEGFDVRDWWRLFDTEQGATQSELLLASSVGQ